MSRMFLAGMTPFCLLEASGHVGECRRWNPRALDRQVSRRFVRQQPGVAQLIRECRRDGRVPEIRPQVEVVVPMMLEVCVLDAVGDEYGIFLPVKSRAG